MNDGDLTHFCTPAHDWLDMMYLGNWIVFGSPVLWPPRLSDRTLLGTFPLGRKEMATEMDLVARLHTACTSENIAMLRREQSSVPRRVQNCLDMNGGHFEHSTFINICKYCC
ncbi:uncharacterized protein TNCV_4266721 [Trichonephila clavipes]|nr:uncharacterized protein TNCV_4266721 [Trichonephila clavipes]